MATYGFLATAVFVGIVIVSTLIALPKALDLEEQIFLLELLGVSAFVEVALVAATHACVKGRLSRVALVSIVVSLCAATALLVVGWPRV